MWTLSLCCVHALINELLSWKHLWHVHHVNFRVGWAQYDVLTYPFGVGKVGLDVLIYPTDNVLEWLTGKSEQFVQPVLEPKDSFPFSCCFSAASLILMFSVRQSVSTFLHRYELFRHLRTISVRLTCGTTLRIRLQSLLNTIMMPSNGLSVLFSNCTVWSTASNVRQSIIDTSSTIMRCIILMSVVSILLMLQVDSSVIMRGHLVWLWKVVPLRRRVAAIATCSCCKGYFALCLDIFLRI